MALNIASFNLRGLRSGLSMLSELCATNSIIALQELWLRPDELDKLDIINSDFSYKACSGMKAAVANNIISGRPFGGVGFVWHKSLNRYMEFIKCDSDGRCIVFRLKLASKLVLMCNLYMPCSDNSSEYKNDISFYAGFLSDVLMSVSHTDVMLMGDFNFEINHSSHGYIIFQQLLDEYHLTYCDSFIKGPDVFTYVNEALNCRSCIDHFIVSSSLTQCVNNVSIVINHLNFSDHRPIVLSLDLVMNDQLFAEVNRSKTFYKTRWDKGNINEFYCISREMLSAVPFLELNNFVCDIDKLNIYYDHIVNSLLTAEQLTIPRIPCSALKPFWNDHLDELKHKSLFWHYMWCSANKPNSGIVFQLKRSTKLKYKLAIRQAFAIYENRFDDDLGNHFVNKKMPEFWKTWSAKFRRNVSNDVYINGSNDSSSVANAFASHFSKVYMCNASASETDKDEIKLFLDSYSGKELNALDLFKSINVEVVDNCIRRLKRGKASGPDHLSVEHLVNAHPILVMHLCNLFRIMLVTGLVPDSFGCGIVIPLLKDKTGDINSLDNYRGITLIPVVAKLFEGVLLDICSDFLVTDDLQFGFKANIGCSNAIFALRSTIDYFQNHGSSVFAASLDISKAFDNVNHYKLFVALSKTGLPKNCLVLLVNWYGKLCAAVRWKGHLSSYFHVLSGVRQGSSLSPSLFNIFMNIFIVRLRALHCGCSIDGHFLGCLLYADDMILLSASVDGLQKMLDCCFDVSCEVLLTFNCSKSCCFEIGKSKGKPVSDMRLGLDTISWSNSFKYLGVSFHAGHSLRVNVEVIKHKFFAACNSVLGNSHLLDQLLQLKLQESFCLPLLHYGLCAVKLTVSQGAELNCCWNTVFRRIFNFRKYDSVRSCICGLGRLDFHHIRINLMLKFVKNCLLSSNVIVRFFGRLFTLSAAFSNECSLVNLKPSAIQRMSFGEIRCQVFSNFQTLCC